MKTLTLLEPPSPELVQIVLGRYGLEKEYARDDHPQEDFLLVSPKYPIFAVADGVTLMQYLVEGTRYPASSPAGDVARIFCEALVAAADERYADFTEADIPEIFRRGNEAVRAYNEAHGRTKESVDFWDTDFYAATAAFAVMKGEQVYWGSICDSYVAHFHEAKLVFQSPGCDERKEAEGPKYEGDPDDKKARARFAWSAKRNALNSLGQRTGYGVITGEATAERYLNAGNFSFGPGDSLAVCTDGFEDYLRLPEFATLFSGGEDSLFEGLKSLTKRKAGEDPEKFGHERSLILVSSLLEK